MPKGTRQLTETEVRVLQAIADTGSMGEAADKLGIARSTVETHAGRARLRLGVHTTLGAVVRAMRAGNIR